MKKRPPRRFHSFRNDGDELVLIILGRPFLAAARAVIDVHERKLSLRVRSETVTFNIGKSMKSKHFREDYLYYADHTSNLDHEQWVDTVNHDGKWTEVEEEEDSNERIKRKPHSPALTEPSHINQCFSECAMLQQPFSANLEKMLKRCEETILVLNWEKCHFILEEGPSSAIRSQVQELRRFIKDFSQVARPITQLLVKDAPFNFSEECIQSFDKLKRELTQAPIMIKPDSSLPFEVMCDASDYAVGTVLGKRTNKPSFSRIILLCADHLSRLENRDLGKVTKVQIRDLFPEERLMPVSDKNNEPWYADYANYLASRVLVLPLLQEKFLKSVSAGHISFEMHISWSKFAMHVNEPEISLQGTKHLKSTSKSVKYLMFRE
uniref:Reverse transcriptase n=1 Tax=Tanacetum cinerariifolium TaxID=118510 RepID=A0A699GTL3_TANCI|nr:reverse transcriptase [Tanacetum cinerariifolium]